MLHADIAGSTALVLRHETRAHDAMQRVFTRLAAALENYGGRVLETRGDALVAEFSGASDAIIAALAGQRAAQAGEVGDEIELDLKVRVGIAIGDVVVGDGTVTGGGVVLAQRVEQLAAPGGVCIHGAVRDAVSRELPVRFEPLERQALKGFNEPTQPYAVTLLEDAAMPAPTAGRKSPRPQSPTRRRIFTPGVLTLLMVLFLAAFVTVRLWPVGLGVGEPAIEPARPAIAVLPFANRSKDPEQVYFAEGIAEDIITDLGSVSGLMVIARNSSFSYRDSDTPLATIARELGVRYVLSGSVRRAGAQMRISAQLVDTDSSEEIWAGRFDGTATDVFALQDQVSEKIIETLAVQLTEVERASLTQTPTDNLEAYEHYLRGRAHIAENSGVSSMRAINALQSATKADPDFTIAWAALAMAYTRAQLQPLTSSVALLSDKTLGVKEVDEQGGSILGTSAGLAFDRDRSLKHAHKAPSPLSRAAASMVALYSRKFDSAVRDAQLAAQGAPQDPLVLEALVRALIYSGDVSGALTTIEEWRRRDPSASAAQKLLLRGLALWSQQDLDGAIEQFEQVATLQENHFELAPLYAVALFENGRAEEAKRWLKRYYDSWQAWGAVDRTVAKALYRHGMFKSAEVGNRFARALIGAGAEPGIYVVPDEAGRLDADGFAVSGMFGSVMRITTTSMGTALNFLEDVLIADDGTVAFASHAAPLSAGSAARISEGQLCGEFVVRGRVPEESCNIVFRNSDHGALEAGYYFIDHNHVLWVFDIESRVAAYRRYTQEIENGYEIYADFRAAIFEQMTPEERAQIR